ncbi:ArnT family glycosyltransferase [Entomobacter blattae]|uniref:Undecaprenyl phosphate-alpha-4-amino-4-deoxy-L-arabinose arabinosyl transferase n=1 Tax=Entomobacter blattae TaxID=2762277 RepID=A0A7H1NPR3_9PROT|nr:glycosyltransferase family 39 protein [Entomobacter blattae]QNT77773.1 Undecaprenyl phosphate-alpha-4-amino-4-deoxy-L-arabinose arabinosyl transferase [Entomobacter blattae]
MHLASRLCVAIAIVVFFLFLPGRASLPPLDRDEARYMQATSQMVESGDWIDVRFQDKPRYLQPAGIYWLEALAVKAAGPRYERATWPYRIPSLLSACAAVLLTMWLGSALFGLPAGVLAAGLLATSVLLTAESRMATIDTTLLMFVLLAEAAILKAWQNNALPRLLPLRYAFLYWGAIGCGLMLKGPVILIPALGTPLALMIIERQKDWWRHLRPSWGWGLTVLIVIPWCLAIGILTHGDFYTHSLGTNFFGKVANGRESHGLPPGYHIAILSIGFWPASLFLAMALPFIWLNRYKAETRFLICWIVPHWLVFEAIATKLPHYVLPIYPALAILTASAFTHTQSWRWPKSLLGKILLGVYALIWLGTGLLLAIAGPYLLWKQEQLLSPAAIVIAVGALPLIILTLWFVWKKNIWRAVACALGSAAIIYIGLFLTVIPKLSTLWLSPRLAQMIEDIKPCPHPFLASVSYSEPSLVFLTEGKIHLLNIEDAVKALPAHQDCALILADKKDEGLLMETLKHQNLHATKRAIVKGVNYSNGKKLEIGFFQPAP